MLTTKNLFSSRTSWSFHCHIQDELSQIRLIPRAWFLYGLSKNSAYEQRWTQRITQQWRWNGWLHQITRSGKLQNSVKLKEVLSYFTLTNFFQIKNLYNEKEELMVANKSLAEYNLSQEPHLTAKKTKLTEKHREAIELVSAVKEAKSKLESKTGKIQPDSLYYLLEVQVYLKTQNDS